MATITGFTADRMQQIENESINSGLVVGNNLVLTRRDGTQINAGNVRGATGPAGPPGEVSEAELAAAVATLNGTIADGPQGVLHAVEVLTDSTIAGFSENVWHDVPGTTITFTPQVGRYYQFLAHVARQSEEANTSFDLRVVRGSSAVCAGFARPSPANKTVPLNAHRTLLVPVGWAGSQTFKLQTRHDTGFTTYIKGTGYPTAFSITDVGGS